MAPQGETGHIHPVPRYQVTTVPTGYGRDDANRITLGNVIKTTTNRTEVEDRRHADVPAPATLSLS
ncbi:hypothetical protein GCM10010411_29240 [Actinomadura fulvescens]|uniref:Uncharacterized protein n=1 Tax=Actinomadura fulvescens TaxID=46160 RepID=A0ABN3PMY9_9ACTN